MSLILYVVFGELRLLLIVCRGKAILVWKGHVVDGVSLRLSDTISLYSDHFLVGGKNSSVFEFHVHTMLHYHF